VVDTRRKKGLRLVLALWVAHQDPTYQDRVEAGFTFQRIKW
jgi:hypothetical protein